MHLDQTLASHQPAQHRLMQGGKEALCPRHLLDIATARHVHTTGFWRVPPALLLLLVQMVVVFPEERKLCYQVFKGERLLASVPVALHRMHSRPPLYVTVKEEVTEPG